jgi:hypothetical protein
MMAVNEGRGRTRIVKIGKKFGMLNGSTFQYRIARCSSRRPRLAFAGRDQGGLFPSRNQKQFPLPYLEHDLPEPFMIPPRKMGCILYHRQFKVPMDDVF